MKPPKKPSKESPLPSQDEHRRFNVLQEQILSKFQTFGEGQSHMLERLDRIEPKLDGLDQKVDLLESAVRTNSKDISALKDAVRSNTEAIHGMQAELKNINQRLEVVEAKGH